MKRFQILIFGVLLGLITGGVIVLISSYPSGTEIQILPAPTPKSPIVYITGEINTPGLYTMPKGSRIGDIIDVSGGLTKSADVSNINLAQILRDGEKIIIPDISVNVDNPNVEANPILKTFVDINTAGVAELDTLPGIGLMKAEEILKYRNEHGNFDSIEEINNIPGIGPVIFSQIQNLITVSPK